ncbi:Serine/threonine-protein kinase PrkC [Stieleria neptunia]|uniref:Serine/threonine-protein kinase PrkC n=1 Tax=Stieleria neptunia TaxID=2527979 RepID=A0A518HXT8_9BACT|nr:LamG-like jellyroll fold domain-containing protein [Stieleria neptunia]QDV45676.1 Serine/threonine-protein kinase PrkC [Stieleria neptunia]
MKFELDPAAGLSNAERSSFDSFILDFEARWSPDAFEPFARRLVALRGRLAESLLCEMVLIDIERQWDHGIAVRVEDYLIAYPEITGEDSGPPDSVQLGFVVAEIEARADTGNALTRGEILARFPNLAEKLEPLLQSRGQADTRVIENGDTSRSPSADDDDGSHRGRPQIRKSPPLPYEFGRYRVIRRIADGGMGAVYLASDTSLYDRQVALKVPHFLADSQEDLECKTRFFAEARAASRLDKHPHLCSIYEIGQIDGIDYISMMYVEGETLETRLQKRGRLDQRKSAALVIKVAEAIHYAHQRGIIHRDLKLANIMLNSLGEPMVMDFGLARLVGETESTRLTRHGALIGTPTYMSPEQVRADPDDIHAATDIYSLGVVLYHLLTGRLPFQGSLGTIMSGVLRDAPVPPSRHLPSLDPELETICLTMMSKRAEDRYASMEEVSGRLGQWLQREPTREVDCSASSRSFPLRIGLVASALSVLLLVVLSVVLIVRTQHGEVRFEIEPSEIAVIIDGNRFNLEDLRQPQQLHSGPHELAIEIGGTPVPLDRDFSIETVEFQGRAKLAVEIDGASVTADQFDVTRGEEHVMRVALIEMTSAETSSQTKPVQPVAPSAASPQHTLQTALEFNGVDSYVSIPSFRYDGSFPITVEALVTPLGNVVDGHLVSNTQRSGFSLVTQKDQWMFYFRDLEAYRHAQTPRSEQGRPVHLAGVYDGHEVCLFMDGHAMHRVKVQYEHRPSAQHLFLGAGNNKINEPEAFFSGLIHFVRLSKGARYGADFQVPSRIESDADTLALYDFNEQAGDVLFDRSGNGHDGKIHNARWVRNEVAAPPALNQRSLIHRWTTAEHDDRVRAVAVSPDQSLLASGSYDGTVGIWDAKTGQLKRRISVMPKKVIDLAIAPDGRSLAVCGWDDQVQLLNMETGQKLSTFRVPTSLRKSAITGVRFSPQGDRLVSGGWDGKVIVWDIASGRKINGFHYPHGRVHCIAVSEDAGLIAAAGDRTIQIWNAAKRKALVNLKGHCNTVMALAFSHDGTELLSASQDGSIRRWDTRDGSLKHAWWNVEPLVDVQWLRDNKTVVSKDQSGRVRFWNASTGQRLGETTTHLGQLGTIALLNDDAQLATCGDKGQVKLWDVAEPPAAENHANQPRPSGPEGSDNRVLYCDGVSSHLRVPEFRYDGTHPITIETWLRLPTLESNPTDARPGVISQNDGRGLNLLLMERGFFQSGAAGCGNVIADCVAATDRWTHVAFTYDHPTLQLFVDGRLQSKRSAKAPFRPGDKDFIVAADPTTATGVSRHLRALFDEVRFSKVVRYRDPFIPPTRHETDADTILLYHFDDLSIDRAHDATGNGFDAEIHRARVVPDGDLPPGFDRDEGLRLDSNRRDNRFSEAFGAVAGHTPTAVKDYDNAYRSSDGENSNRWHAAGHLNIQTNGGSKAWNALSVQRGLLEVTARSVSEGSSWMVNLTNVRLRRGIRILVRADGKIVYGPSLFQFSPRFPDRLLTEIPADSTKQFHALGIAVHQRAFQVFWDGAAISDRIDLDFDLAPSAVALGNHGSGHTAFNEVRYWRPFDARETADGPGQASRHDKGSRSPDGGMGETGMAE